MDTLLGLKVTILNLANLQCLTASVPISSTSSTTDLVNSLISITQTTGVVTSLVSQQHLTLALAAPPSASTDCPSVVNMVKNLAPAQLVDTSTVTSAIGQNMGAISIPGLCKKL